jgi:hypothetical protein
MGLKMRWGSCVRRIPNLGRGKIVDAILQLQRFDISTQSRGTSLSTRYTVNACPWMIPALSWSLQPNRATHFAA